MPILERLTRASRLVSADRLSRFQQESTNTMKRTDTDNITTKLEHVLALGDMLCEQYRHITCTERTALLMAMLAAVKSVSCNVAIMRELLVKNIVDTFKIKYLQYAQLFEILHRRLLTEVAGAPMVDALDTLQRPIVGTDKIVAHENDLYRISDCKNLTGFEYVQKYLVHHATHVFDEVLDGLQLIAADLKGIDSDYYRMKEDEVGVRAAFERLRMMYEQQTAGEEQDELQDLADNLDCYLTKHGCGARAMERFIRGYMEDCGELAQASFDGFDPAMELLQNRDTYTMGDVSEYFCEMKGYNMLLEMQQKMAEAEKRGELPKKEVGDRVFVVMGKYIENVNNYIINKL